MVENADQSAAEPPMQQVAVIHERYDAQGRTSYTVMVDARVLAIASKLSAAIDDVTAGHAAAETTPPAA